MTTATAIAEKLTAALRRGQPEAPRAPRPSPITPATGLEERRAALDELTRVRDSQHALQGLLAGRLREADAQIEAAERLVQERRQERDEVQRLIWAADAQESPRIRQLEGRLIAGAPALLDECETTWRRLLDETLRGFETMGPYPGEPDGLGRTRDEYVSNADGVQRVAALIRAAIAELPALRLEPDPDVIVARLDALLATIPRHPDGTVDIPTVQRPVRVLGPGELRELRWRLEGQERRRWNA